MPATAFHSFPSTTLFRSQAPPMTTRRETTVVVTLPGGQKYEGRLERIDDFMVTLTQADGTPRSFRRNGDVPKVDVRDPRSEEHTSALQSPCNLVCRLLLE